MSDSSQKMSSSLAPCSEKRNSKRGGYASVFFQLFDWNRHLNGKRLLSRKLLPAERPIKHASKHHMDEKLPVAKLLLIAEENRGGFPRCLPTEAGEVLRKEKTPEKKKNRRGPGVVAKLMGLETMPSPEPPKDLKQGKDNLYKFDENCDPKAPSFRARSAVVDGGVSKKPFEGTHASDGLHVKPACALVPLKSNDPKITFFCKLPALSPRKSEGALRSILSPSKSHNKMLSPIKSPLSSKRAARLLEAAAKMLEPSMQPSVRVRGLAINSQIARLSNDASHEDQKSGDLASRPALSGLKKKPPLASDAKKQQQNVTLRVYADQPKAQAKPKQEKKPVSVLDATASCKSHVPVTNRRAPYMPSSNQESLRRSGSTKEESACHGTFSAGQQRLIRSKSVRDEPEQGKSTYFNQTIARIAKEDKGRMESRKQQQTCNRVSQPDVGVKKKGPNLAPTDEHPGDAENQNPNVMVSSALVDVRKSILTDSVAMSSGSTSGILNYSRLFGARKTGIKDESSKKAQKKGDPSVMKSFLRKRPAISDNTTRSGSKAVLKEPSQVSKSGKVKTSEKLVQVDSQNGISPLASPCITQEVSVEKNEPSPCDMVGSAFHAPTDSSRADMEASNIWNDSCEKITRKDNTKKQEGSPESYEAVDSSSPCASDVRALQLSVQSVCDSSSGDVGDSLSSSYGCMEFSKHRKKKPVSYSGKSTAAILQELLMALNSAKSQAALDESMHSKSDSSSKFTLHAELGDDFADSASSAAVMMSDNLRITPMAIRRNNSRGECRDEWRHPSPVSILEFPSGDSSSASSDNFEDAQERKLLSRVLPKNQHAFVSRRHHYIDLPPMEKELTPFKEASECEEEYVKDVLRMAKLSPSDIYAVKLRLPSRTLLDPVVFTTLEEQYFQQWQWGIMPGNACSDRRSIDTPFTQSLYAEAGMQNRKLVFECVNEALTLQLGIDEYRCRQSFSQGLLCSSERHISQSVCKQVDAWGKTGCSMNVDDMVDQEMSTGFGKWVDFSDEVLDLASDMEGNIVRGLIDELVKDLGGRMPLPKRQSSRKEFIRMTW